MSVRKPKKFNRKNPGQAMIDPVAVQAINYNQYSGAYKNIPSGPTYIPLRVSNTFTTDATTAKSIPKGAIVAVFNKSATTLYAITFGVDSSVTALAAGVVGTGDQVGLPCKPMEWSYFTAGVATGAAGADDDKVRNWVISENANLLVYLVKDDSDAEMLG